MSIYKETTNQVRWQNSFDFRAKIVRLSLRLLVRACLAHATEISTHGKVDLTAE